MKKNKIIYSITVEDVLTVAKESIKRKPTKKELGFIEEKIGDYIEWHDIIDNLLGEFGREQGKRKE